jgi:two-component system phosphate regulon response regulator PhoB
MKLLLVEDDQEAADYLKRALEETGHSVDHAAEGREGLLSAAGNPYDVIILDRMLPEMDGLSILRTLRAARVRTPVLLLTAIQGIDDRVEGLDAGADDYLVKPFAMGELTARLRAVLRRIRPGLAEDRIRHADIVIDRVAHRVKRGEREIHLGPTEFRLLDYFMQHPGRVFSREQLLDAVWGSDVYVETRTVDVHVGRLRKALNRDDEGDPIRTVRSAGYSLDTDTIL